MITRVKCNVVLGIVIHEGASASLFTGITHFSRLRFVLFHM